MAENPVTPRRVAIASVLIIIVVVVVVETSTTCYSVEAPSETVRRLYCENQTNPVQDFVLPSEDATPFASCSTSMDSSWVVLPSGHCGMPSACLVVGLNFFLDFLALNPVAGFFVLVFVNMLLTLLFVPGSIIAIGVGAAFTETFGLGIGTLLGSMNIWIGAMMGSVLCFLAGRYFFRETIQRYINKRVWLRAIDRAMAVQGLKIQILLRLSPIIPFNVFNYVMGCTACDTKTFLVGSAVGIIPGTVAYVFLGGAVSAAFDNGEEMMMMKMYNCEAGEDSVQSQRIRLILSVVGGIATVLGVGVIAWYSKRQINAIIEEDARKERESLRSHDSAGNDGSTQVDEEAPTGDSPPTSPPPSIIVKNNKVQEIPQNQAPPTKGALPKEPSSKPTMNDDQPSVGFQGDIDHL